MLLMHSCMLVCLYAGDLEVPHPQHICFMCYSANVNRPVLSIVEFLFAIESTSKMAALEFLDFQTNCDDYV